MKNKKFKKFLIVLFIIIFLISIIVFTINILKTKYRSIYKVSDEIIYEETYTDIFNEIDIDIKMSDIYIKESLDNTTKIIIYGEKDYIIPTIKDNKLFIDIKNKNFIAFDFYSFISKIELYLPNNYNDVIRINNEYGNIEIDKFNESSMYIEQNYGDIYVLDSKYIKIYNKYGKINIDNSNMIRINSFKSNINIDKTSDIVIENKFGNVKINNIDKYLKLINENGNINIESIFLEKDSIIDTEYGNVEISNIKDICIDAKKERNKVKINNNYKKEKIKLKINNKKGDIIINN